MTIARGKLIVLEGAEGVGKTTQLRRLGETLTARGISFLGVREPGGTAIGAALRKQDPLPPTTAWDPLELSWASGAGGMLGRGWAAIMASSLAM